MRRVPNKPYFSTVPRHPQTRPGVAISAVLAMLCMATPTQADIRTETLEYQVNGEPYTGYLAYDDSISGPRAGILVVHEWWGHNDFARRQAERLAAAGYTALALDMYGSGKVAEHPDDAKAFMQAATAEPQQVRERFVAAMALLQAQDTVDPGKIAAQGYCFGGAVVLNMARLGIADLSGVVSIHGALASPIQAEPGQVTARVQVYTGGADQMVPAEQVAGLLTEMQSAGVDLSLTTFPGVRHSFSNPDADRVAEEFGMPIGYDQQAADRTWRGTLAFYRELFGQ